MAEPLPVLDPRLRAALDAFYGTEWPGLISDGILARSIIDKMARAIDAADAVRVGTYVAPTPEPATPIIPNPAVPPISKLTHCPLSREAAHLRATGRLGKGGRSLAWAGALVVVRDGAGRPLAPLALPNVKPRPVLGLKRFSPASRPARAVDAVERGVGA